MASNWLATWTNWCICQYMVGGDTQFCYNRQEGFTYGKGIYNGG